MLVRPLRPADINAAMVLMGYYNDEFEIEDWDEDEVVQTLKQYSIASGSQCLVGVEGDRIVAILLGVASKEVYSRRFQSIITLMYILHSHRNNENYQQLYGEFLNWSKTFRSEKVILMDTIKDDRDLSAIAGNLNFNNVKINTYQKEVN